MKNKYKPDYAVSPMETLAEFSLHQVFGSELVERFEKEGITEENVYLITAMFPKPPKSFWLKLQKNYDETVKRLESHNRVKATKK